MDARKVLQMGGGTVLISLPKSWAKKNGIVKGGSVMVEEISPKRLMVSPIGGEQERRRAAIGYPKEDLTQVTNDVIGAYLLGYDTISIEGTQAISREDREKLKAVVSRLVGLEIMEEDSKSVTLQFLPEPSSLDPEKMVRRMANLTRGMLRDARDALASGDRKMMSLIAERDDEVDRLYFLMVRAIRTATIDDEVAKRYNLTPVDCLDYRVLASYVEGFGDAVAEFSNKVSVEPPTGKAAQELASVLDTLEEMEDTSVRIFVGRRSGQSRRGYLLVDVLHQKAAAQLAKIAQDGLLSTRTMVDLLSMLERASKALVDISDLALPTYQFNETVADR